MDATILVKFQGGRAEVFLNCTHEEEETLAPIMTEIRRVVEEGLELVKTDELIESVTG